MGLRKKSERSEMLKRMLKIDLPFLAIMTLSNVIAYASIVISGRMLGPHEFGKVGALLGLYYILIIPGSIIQMNFARLSSHNKDNSVHIKNLVASGFYKFLPLSLGILVAIILTTPFLSPLLKINSPASFSLLAVTMASFYLLSILSGVVQGLHKFIKLGFLNIVLSILKISVAVPLIAFGLQAPAVIAGYLSATLGAAVYCLFILKIKNPFSGARDLKVFDKNSAVLFLTMIGMVIVNESSILFVKAFLDYDTAGNYAAMVTLGNAIIFSVGAIIQILFPTVSNAYKNNKDFCKPAKRTFFSAFAICVLAMLAYYLLPDSFWALLFGKKFSLDVVLLVAYSGFASLFALSSFFVNFLLALENKKIWLASLAAATMEIILILFFHQDIFQIILSLLLPVVILLSYLIFATIKTLKHIYEPTNSSTNTTNLG